MNFSFLRRSTRLLFAGSLVSLVAFGLVSCGGGGGGSDDGNATVRPKTMDGIVLDLDSAASFEFIRNTGSAGAVNNGDVESGTFIYTPRIANDALKLYDNLNGDKSNFRYPLSVTAATYTYRAINDSSAVLTLTATGAFDPFFTLPGGATIALNDSWIRLFYSYSPQVFVSNTRVAEIAITFKDNVSFVTSEIVTLRLPESPLVNTFDTVRIPSSIALATFVPVPLNYNPVVTERAPSRIAPATLTNRLMKATNGIPDATKDFTIQFTADAATPGVATEADSVEIGRGLLSVYNPSSVPPGLTAVSIALDYTWRRIAGTDRGELVLSNIPDNPALPFDTSLNGTLTLSFTGQETGNYSGAADGDTANPADVAGTFIIPANGTP
jgi:hypothetical protein